MIKTDIENYVIHEADMLSKIASRIILKAMTESEDGDYFVDEKTIIEQFNLPNDFIERFGNDLEMTIWGHFSSILEDLNFKRIKNKSYFALSIYHYSMPRILKYDRDLIYVGEN